MNFEEKIDAMRTTLELAMLDLEALRGRTEALHERMEEQHANIESLRIASASQYDSIQGLMKITDQLVTVVRVHDGRLSRLEHGERPE